MMQNNTQILRQIRNNPQAMNNKTVQNVYALLDSNNHNGLVELYKQTCQTMGVQPNPEYLK